MLNVKPFSEKELREISREVINIIKKGVKFQ